jgi:hypothetical protein
MRLLGLAVILLIAAGCDWNYCRSGDVDTCYCSPYNDPRVIVCTFSEWPECPCGEDYNDGIDGWQPGDPPYGDDPWAQHDDLLDYFPQYEGSYTDNCAAGEIKIPGKPLCWRRCIPGSEWYEGEGTCHGVLNYDTHEGALQQCKQINGQYRLPTAEEAAYLLNYCEAWAFNPQVANYCGPYAESAMRYVLELGTLSSAYIWLGELGACVDPYDEVTDSCAWHMRLFNTIEIPSEFNWLIGASIPNAALGLPTCIREQP